MRRASATSSRKTYTGSCGTVLCSSVTQVPSFLCLEAVVWPWFIIGETMLRQRWSWHSNAKYRRKCLELSLFKGWIWKSRIGSHYYFSCNWYELSNWNSSKSLKYSYQSTEVVSQLKVLRRWTSAILRKKYNFAISVECIWILFLS